MRIQKIGLAALLCACFSILAPEAWADSIELRDGTVLQGQFIGGSEYNVTFRIADRLANVPIKDIAHIRLAPRAENGDGDTSDEATEDTAAQPERAVIVGAGVTLMVRTLETIDAGTAQDGEQYSARLANDLRVNGALVATAGTKAYVEVLNVGADVGLELVLSEIRIGDQYQSLHTTSHVLAGGTAEARSRIPGGSLLEFQLQQPFTTRLAGVTSAE